jgi:hypothetical protein
MYRACSVTHPVERFARDWFPTGVVVDAHPAERFAGVTSTTQHGRRRIYARPAGDSEADWEAFVEQFIAQVDVLIAEAEAEPTVAAMEPGQPTGQPTEGEGRVID